MFAQRFDLLFLLQALLHYFGFELLAHGLLLLMQYLPVSFSLFLDSLFDQSLFSLLALFERSFFFVLTQAEVLFHLKLLLEIVFVFFQATLALSFVCFDSCLSVCFILSQPNSTLLFQFVLLDFKLQFPLNPLLFGLLRST